jgi:hypothetical protein
MKSTVSKRPNGNKKRSRAGKRFASAFLAVILLAAAVVVCVLTRFDTLLKAAIEKYGSRATGTAVRVGSIHVGLKEGKGELRGLTIANPPGFRGMYAFSLGETAIGIDIKSITRNVKVIDEILVRGLKIDFETNEDRSVNLNELKNHLAPEKRSEPRKKAGKSGDGPRLIIRRLLFTEGVVHVRMATGVEKKYELPLPAVEMRNLGGNSGAAPDQIARQIIGELCGRALREVERKAAGAAADKAREKGKELLRKEGLGRLLR